MPRLESGSLCHSAHVEIRRFFSGVSSLFFTRVLGTILAAWQALSLWAISIGHTFLVHALHWEDRRLGPLVSMYSLLCPVIYVLLLYSFIFNIGAYNSTQTSFELWSLILWVLYHRYMPPYLASSSGLCPLLLICECCFGNGKREGVLSWSLEAAVLADLLLTRHPAFDAFSAALGSMLCCVLGCPVLGWQLHSSTRACVLSTPLWLASLTAFFRWFWAVSFVSSFISKWHNTLPHEVYLVLRSRGCQATMSSFLLQFPSASISG